MGTDADTAGTIVSSMISERSAAAARVRLGLMKHHCTGRLLISGEAARLGGTNGVAR